MHVRHASTLLIERTFTATSSSPISSLQWSPDSLYLLLVHQSTQLLQVFSLSTPSLVCRVDESLYGLCTARFTPDSRHLLTTSPDALRLSIHSLLTSHSYHIRRPKHSTTAAHFSPDASLLLTAERHRNTDHLCLYDTHTWQEVGHWPVGGGAGGGEGGGWCVDLWDFVWAPDSTRVAVWQGVLECAVDVWAIDGRRVWGWRGEDGALGVSRVEWSRDGLFLVVGGYDEHVRVFHAGTGKMIAEWAVEERVRGKGVTVYRECRSEDVLSGGLGGKENEGDGFDESIVTDLSLGRDEEVDGSRGSRPGHKHALSTLPKSVGAAVASGKVGTKGHRSSQSISAARPPLASSRLPSSSSNRAPMERSTRALSMTSSAVRRSTVGHGPPASSVPTQYVIAPVPFSIPTAHGPALGASLPSTSASAPPPLPSIGICLLSFSLSSTFLAVRSLSLPSSLFLYHLPTLSLHCVLVHLHPVDDASWWREDDADVLLCTCKGGLAKVFRWREDGAGVVEVPRQGFGVRKVAWGSGQDGVRLCLMDKASFCCVYSSNSIATTAPAEAPGAV